MNQKKKKNERLIRWQTNKCCKDCKNWGPNIDDEPELAVGGCCAPSWIGFPGSYRCPEDNFCTDEFEPK